MKIALTSDIHLDNPITTPKRFETLENILINISNQHINTMVIAGDLFDKVSSEYSAFDKLAKKYSHIKFYIIPGNHDSFIDQRFFSQSNIYIYTSPTHLNLNNVILLLIPYKPNISMTEVLEEHYPHNTNTPIIIISHADYIDFNKELNPYEPGIYMPITKKDVQKYNPHKIILGHIHKPIELDKIIYLGSPYPINSSETGKKRYIVLDTNTANFKSYTIDNDVIYLKINLIIFPHPDTISFLKSQITTTLSNNNIQPSEWHKLIVDITLKGYTENKNILIQQLSKLLSDLNINTTINTDELRVSTTSEDYLDIIRTTIDKTDLLLNTNINLNIHTHDIIHYALKIIFGEKI